MLNWEHFDHWPTIGVGLESACIRLGSETRRLRIVLMDGDGERIPGTATMDLPGEYNTWGKLFAAGERWQKIYVEEGLAEPIKVD